MLEISLNVYYTIALAIVVLMVGDFIKKHIEVLRRFCIPTPVVGGVLFAILITILNMSGVCKVSLNSSFNEFFSLLFYAGIGYTASWKLLKKGGPQVILFLLLSSILVVLQNGLGVIVCKIMNVDPLVGLVAPSQWWVETVPLPLGDPLWKRLVWPPVRPWPLPQLPLALLPAPYSGDRLAAT